MRFELIGKTKATLTDIDPQSSKLGPTDTKPAVALTFSVPMANTSLVMLGKNLRSFFFETLGCGFWSFGGCRDNCPASR